MASGDAVHPKVVAATAGGTVSFSIAYALINFLGQLPAIQKLPDSTADALAGLLIAGITAAGTWLSGYLRSSAPKLGTEADKLITSVGAKLGLSSVQVDHLKQVAEGDLQKATDELTALITSSTAPISVDWKDVAATPPASDPVLGDDEAPQAPEEDPTPVA